MRTTTRYILLRLWLLTVTVIAQAAPTAEAPLPEELPAYTLEQVLDDIRQVLPLVERITERKLAQVPTVRPVTRDEYGRMT